MPKPVQAPSLDSLFYKKQGPQAHLKESHFIKKEAVSGEDLMKRMQSFDYKATLQRFELDKHFRAYISTGILKVQRQIGSAALSITDAHPEFLFNGELYRTHGDVASVVKAFKAYRVSLQQFSLYASNNKIDHINTCFNLFWSLTLAAVAQAPDLLTVVREEFMSLAN